MRNKCYSLTVWEKDLSDLAVVGLLTYLREKLEGMEFSDINQVLQLALVHENRARDSRLHNQFREGSRDKD
jgi:hypothetical protein